MCEPISFGALSEEKRYAALKRPSAFIEFVVIEEFYIYRTHLINCNTHHSPSSALLLCVHTRYNLFAHSSCTSLVILIFIKSTVDCIAHFSSLHILLLILFYCFYLLSSFLSYYYLYLNICSCVMYHLLFLFFLHCPLSGPVLTSISLLIIPCMIVYVTNKREP